MKRGNLFRWIFWAVLVVLIVINIPPITFGSTEFIDRALDEMAICAPLARGFVKDNVRFIALSRERYGEVRAYLMNPDFNIVLIPEVYRDLPIWMTMAVLAHEAFHVAEMKEYGWLNYYWLYGTSPEWKTHFEFTATLNPYVQEVRDNCR